MGKPRSHLLDIYDVHLHVATDRRQWATLRRTIKALPTSTDTGGSWFGLVPKPGHRDQNHLAILINVASHCGDAAALVDTCAHEATHGAAMVFESIGAEVTADSEPLAWLVGWLTRWLWEAST